VLFTDLMQATVYRRLPGDAACVSTSLPCVRCEGAVFGVLDILTAALDRFAIRLQFLRLAVETLVNSFFGIVRELPCVWANLRLEGTLSHCTALTFPPCLLSLFPNRRLRLSQAFKPITSTQIRLLIGIVQVFVFGQRVNSGRKRSPLLELTVRLGAKLLG
jgi:hypothetical protein